MNNFNRSNLQSPATYFKGQGLKLAGGGEWKNALCPFHNDHQPSLRVRLDTGGFKCMACGKSGGDILAFHMQRYGLGFIAAAKQLGAWRSV
jgi:DNA primase